MGNNNGYIKVKVSQIDAEKKRLGLTAKKAKGAEKALIVAAIKRLDERRAGYLDQIVDEKPAPSTPPADDESDED
ncbi:hypothetical protein ACTJJ4_11085 [Microbacterium sp. 22195]|uniref:hypothetical protein n=1 Tax=Microbacterium sp. 22195 TaxID=3453891 RepID=UPI003F841DCD